jgi:hypothetical protein
MPLNPNAPEFKPSNHSRRSTRRSPRRSPKNVWKNLGEKHEAIRRNRSKNSNDMKNYLNEIAKMRRNLTNKNSTN